MPIVINGKIIESREPEEYLNMKIPLSLLKKFYENILNKPFEVKRRPRSNGGTFIANGRSLLAPFQSWIFATVEVWASNKKVTLEIRETNEAQNNQRAQRAQRAQH
ncbi:MAG: hypothetical protein DRP00_03910 [Candidatus Aenigmatarchaeota archaeon]|nr:MAG: hypothetical protein DRP00_03910 [Candidatus Aenigmarchaeota archaeon]